MSEQFVYEEKYFAKRPFIYNGENYKQGDVWIPQGLPNDMKIINSGIHVTIKKIKKPFNPELEGYVRVEANDSPTMKDIAQAAGVSRATVSNVINEKEGVAADTRELVIAKAKQIGYQL
jgi:AraC-like DNA-binding protein